MDNRPKEEMQNWKKILIMDPVLNKLFDQNIQIKDFVQDQILMSDHERIMHIYSKLSTIKHALSKNIHKEVESKHEIIEQSFLKKCELSTNLFQKDKQRSAQSEDRFEQITKNLLLLEKYNQKYQSVERNAIKLQNINRVIQFSKGLQKYKINVRLLKTFMKDFKEVEGGRQQSSKSIKASGDSLNLLKISKLLKQLTHIQTSHQLQLQKIRYYQNERQFVSNSKAVLYALAQKQLTKALRKFGKSEDQTGKQTKTTQEVTSLLKILQSVLRLKDFVVTFFRSVLEDSADKLKKLFKIQSISEFQTNFTQSVMPHLLQNSRIFIKMQQLLSQNHMSFGLRSNGIQNLFDKFIDKLSSYFCDLIKWNVQQETKQKNSVLSNKCISSINPFLNRFMGELVKLSNGQQSEHKVCLVLKYPSLLCLLDSLVTSIQLEVISIGKFNTYFMAEKRQKLMLSLTPLSAHFWQIVDGFVAVATNAQENSGTQAIKTLISLIEDGQMVSILIEKILGQLQNSNVTKATREDTQNTKADKQQAQSGMDNKFAKILTTIDNQVVMSKYVNLRRTVDHLNRIKKLKGTNSQQI